MGKPIQYTLRSVPAALDRALRTKAEQERKSLNEVVIEVLRLGVGMPAGELYHDLDHIIGTWKDDPAFHEAIADQDRVDEEMWQ